MESKRLGVKHWLFLLVLGSGLLLAGYWFSARRVPDPDFGSQASVVQLIYITKYSKCGDTATVTTDISRDGLEGLFASLSEDWSTMEERDGKIELTKTVDDWCPQSQLLPADQTLPGTCGCVPWPRPRREVHYPGLQKPRRIRHHTPADP